MRTKSSKGNDKDNEKEKAGTHFDWQKAKARTKIATADVFNKAAASSKTGGLSFGELILFEEKIKLCKLIYRLIISVCHKNPENEKAFSQQISKIQYQAKYLKEAVQCFTAVVTGNEDLLLSISKSLQISEDQNYKIRDDGGAEIAAAYRNINPRLSSGLNIVESPMLKPEKVKYHKY